jgi:hypothetical protein
LPIELFDGRDSLKTQWTPGIVRVHEACVKRRDPERVEMRNAFHVFLGFVIEVEKAGEGLDGKKREGNSVTLLDFHTAAIYYWIGAK